jgi:copper homeostasis protein (lipoprotein)
MMAAPRTAKLIATARSALALAPLSRRKLAPLMHARRAVVLILAMVTGISAAMAETLTGTAHIRERIALPPGAVFEAVIEDVARAGAPATPLAGTVIEGPGQPPIGFSIEYDASALDPRAIYSLRATIRHEGRLLFTTDTVNRVLAEGDPAPVEVDLVLVQGGGGAADPGPGIAAHGLRLPATFRGTLPCADCEGIRHHLDLWPDQHYHLSREWLGKEDGAARRDEIGRWYADPGRGAIVLYGASEMPLFWQVMAPERLRQMDMAGNPIDSDLPYDLTSEGTLEPTELRDLFLLGRMTYMADSARFKECFSGVDYPVAQEGDYLAMERAYLEAAPDPGAPVMVHVEGDLALRTPMEGPPRMSLVVERFIAVRDADACDRPESQASLTDTYWRIDTLMGEAVAVQPNRREPHLVLRGGDERRFRATVGCNQILGAYELNGETLIFGAAASTMMACPPTLDRMERSLSEVLSRTRAVRLAGQGLELLAEDGTTLAQLAAVYLR